MCRLVLERGHGSISKSSSGSSSLNKAESPSSPHDATLSHGDQGQGHTHDHVTQDHHHDHVTPAHNPNVSSGVQQIHKSGAKDLTTAVIEGVNMSTSNQSNQPISGGNSNRSSRKSSKSEHHEEEPGQYIFPFITEGNGFV